MLFSNNYSLLVLSIMTIFSGSSFASWKSTGNNVLTTRLGIQTPQLGFDLNPSSELSGSELKFRPNSPTKTFLSLAYDWAGVSVGAVNPVSIELENEKGETKAQDYQFRFYFEQFSIEVFYQIYSGYYLENTSDVLPAGSQTGYLKYPDLETKNFGISATWVIDPKSYSTAAAFDQSVQQTGSGGTWLLNLAISQNGFSNSNKTLIPTALTGKYGEFENVTSGRMTNFGLGGGGAYTQTFYEKFYLSGMFVLDLAYNYLLYEKSNQDMSETSLGTVSHLKIGTGYNGDKFISGLSLAGDVNQFNIEKVSTSFSTYEINLFFGTRFDL